MNSMPAIILSAILMSFLLWSYNILNKNFVVNADTSVDATKSPTLFLIKRLFITVILFLGCFVFITFAAHASRKSVIDELRQESFKRAQAVQEYQKRKMQENELNIDQAKSNAKDRKGIRVMAPDEVKTKFSDVAGLNEAKDEVKDIVAFLQDPVKFSRLGAKSPKGMLLYGEPGTGKTLLARAMAGEANVAFIAVAGAEFDEEFVGVGASRVRSLFEIARQNAPCIIFIDEIDALAHKRHAHDPSWSAQTVNQLLAEMDGLESNKNEGIIVIGASNRMEAMDPAILRPGRLDRHIKLDIPTQSERAEVIKIYLNKVTVDKNVSAHTLAKITPGFSCAELANLVNEAAIIATKNNKKAIEMQDFDAAKDRIILGSKREALKITPYGRKVTAYHEAGHTLIGHMLNGKNQPVYKVTIAPRGPTLGHTSFEPKNDQYSISLKELEAIIATQLAGRIAEEIIFGEQNITTGAESDLKNATELAYNMVARWGYSKRIGPIYHNKSSDFISKNVIEEEVQAIIKRSYESTKATLLQNRDKLDKLAEALLEKETLDSKEIKQILGN